MQSVGSAIRHTAFAPGDLYLDTRVVPALCRPLSVAEKWKAQGLSREKFELLQAANLEEHAGALAGNSIPAEMTKLVTSVVAKRVHAFSALQQRHNGQMWLPFRRAPSLVEGADLSAVILLIVDPLRGRVATHNGGLPATVRRLSQQQAIGVAGTWASEVLPQSRESLVAASILLERGEKSGRLRAVVVCAESLPTTSVFSWSDLKDLGDSFVALLATEALAQWQRFSSVARDPPVSSWLTGRVVGAAAWAPASDSTASVEDVREFDRALGRASVHKAALRARLAESSCEYLQEWSLVDGECDVSEIPRELRAPFCPSSMEHSKLLFQNPHAPIVSEWAPLPVAVDNVAREAPLRWLSAVRPQFRQEAKRRVDSFQRKLSRWFLSKGSMERPAVVTLPGLWFCHWIFEVPHEFFSMPGWAVPLPIHKPATTHLNLDFIQEMGAEFPDQELISFLVLGVRYKADLPTQVVLQPHSLAFLEVVDKFHVQAEEQIQKGWTHAADSLPLLPYFSHAWGSVARKFEPDRPRMTTDGGSPRVTVWDCDGILVRPLNDVIADLSWPKEVKPRPLMMILAMAILKEAAEILGETVFVFTDDFKSFFNQMRLAPQEYCKTGVMHPPKGNSKSAAFGFDTVLGFGIKMASNIAQRFADFIVHIFKQKLQPVAERLAATWCAKSPTLARWWAHRESLGTDQASLFSVLMYTDDPCFLCVGADMTFEALKCWHWLTSSLNTPMAVPDKRSLGTSAVWIGVQFFSDLGVCTLPTQKVLRACQMINSVLDGSASFDQYRGLIGLLEHFKDVLYLRGNAMYGLYDPMRFQWNPVDRVKPSTLAQSQLVSWAERLEVGVGASVRHAEAYITGQKMQGLSSLPRTVRTLSVFSDAAKEGTTRPGLGGWVCGWYWRLPLTTEHLELDIPILEAIAAVASVVMLSRVIGGVGGLRDSLRLELHVDAEATARMLIKGKAKSPMMVVVHTAALELPEFTSLLPHLTVKHVFGSGNPASDAASRGHFVVLRAIATSLRLKLIRMDAPECAQAMLDLCLSLHRKRAERSQNPPDPAPPRDDVEEAGPSSAAHEALVQTPQQRTVPVQRPAAQGGSRGVRVGEASNPGPTFVPHRCALPLVKAGGAANGGKRSKANETEGFVPHACKRSCRAGPPPAGSTDCRSSPLSTSCAQRSFSFMNNAGELAQELWKDQSPFALCKGNWEQLLQACEIAVSTADSAFSLRTAKQDQGHWQAWVNYCRAMGTTPERPQVDPLRDRTAYLRELVLLINALTFFMKTRKPRSRADEVIKPQSAMNILLGVNRVLKRNHSALIPLKALTVPLKGLMRQFIQRFGPRSLIPKRRSPFTNGMIATMVSLPQGTMLAGLGSLDWSARAGLSLRAALAVATTTGMRKAELFKSDSETFFLTWELVAWVIDGVAVARPSVAQLQALGPADFLVITPPPSKADQFNTVWGSAPMYAPFRNTLRNAARAMAELVIKVGPSKCRADEAVFTNNAGLPLTTTLMSEVLKAMIASFLPAEASTLYSWHSARVYLATALHAAGCKPALIQALLRWQTEESLRLYALTSRHEAANLLDKAATANVAAIRSSALPIYEQFDLFVAMNDAVDALERTD
jgi:hypothetical protein